MSEELDDILLEVREDASALRGYLSEVGTTAEQLNDAREALFAARDRVDTVSGKVAELVGRVDDLVTEMLRLDPRAIGDRLSRLDERLEILRGNLRELRDLRLDAQVGAVQAQLRQQRALILLLTAMVAVITGLLGFRFFAGT